MTYSLLTHVSAKTLDINNITTGTIDTSGADLLIALIADYNVNATTLSDSKSNSYTSSISKIQAATEAQLYYKTSPTVGSSHSFTASSTAGYPSICASSFSGAGASPFDQSSTAGASGVTSLATGSVTPSEDNELIVASIAWQNSITGLAIDSSFTIIEEQSVTPAINFGSAIAYLIQTSASAVNPTWSWTGSVNAAVLIATFKAAAGGNVVGRGHLESLKLARKQRWI